MDRQTKLALAVVTGFAGALAAAAVLQPRPVELFQKAGPIIEDQFRQTLESLGYANVQIERERNYLKAIGAMPTIELR